MPICQGINTEDDAIRARQPDQAEDVAGQSPVSGGPRRWVYSYNAGDMFILDADSHVLTYLFHLTHSERNRAKHQSAWKQVAQRYTKIPGAAASCWNSPNIQAAETIPAPPFVSHRRRLWNRVSQIQQNVTPAIEFLFTDRSKAAPRGVAYARTAPDTYHARVKRAICSDTSLSSTDPIYMPSFPFSSGAQQTLHTTWHHLEAISDPPSCREWAHRETLRKSCMDT